MQLLPPLVALLAAPFLFGLLNRVKALFGGRRGQPLLQAYFDMWKLLRKGAVYGNPTTWVFRLGAPVALAAILLALCLLPFGGTAAPLAFSGDLFLFVYLLALARFAIILSALDTSSPFEGMGASREAMFSALAEPVLFCCLLAVQAPGGGFSLSGAPAPMPAGGLVTALLLASALFIVLLAENSRIPFDDPNTHLELTMIHEVMVLDHSGPDFALIEYAATLKFWMFSVLVLAMLPSFAGLPVWAAWLGGAAGLLALTVLTGVVESVMARLRLPRVPQLLAGAFALALLGLFFSRLPAA